MNRGQRVISYIEKHGSITTRQAFTDLGVTRLSDVVWKLRKDGVNIIGTPEQGLNRYGEKVSYNRYHIEQ